jgi:hypothetical protein
MSTTKQIEANRQNAQRSTGPRSPEGKAACRFNALKSGIDAQAQVIPGEDPAQLEALVVEYQERFDASTPECRMLVDTLIACEWQFRRLNRAEASLWQFAVMDTERTFSSNDHPEGRVLDVRGREFERLQRRINATHRNYDRALKELQGIEAKAAADPPAELPTPPPEPLGIALSTPIQSPSNQQPDIRIGFVPSTPSLELVPPAFPPQTHARNRLVTHS